MALTGVGAGANIWLGVENKNLATQVKAKADAEEAKQAEEAKKVAEDKELADIAKNYAETEQEVIDYAKNKDTPECKEIMSLQNENHQFSPETIAEYKDKMNKMITLYAKCEESFLATPPSPLLSNIPTERENIKINQYLPNVQKINPEEVTIPFKTESMIQEEAKEEAAKKKAEEVKQAEEVANSGAYSGGFSSGSISASSVIADNQEKAEVMSQTNTYNYLDNLVKLGLKTNDDEKSSPAYFGGEGSGSTSAPSKKSKQIKKLERQAASEIKKQEKNKSKNKVNEFDVKNEVNTYFKQTPVKTNVEEYKIDLDKIINK